MLKYLIALAAIVPALACAASLTLPNVVVTSAASTSIACTPTGASYPAPMALGTVAFNCSVQPAGWTGAVSISGSQFGVSALSGTSFTVTVIGSALAAGSYSPGVLTSVP
jgi:hypothetical protein